MDWRRILGLGVTVLMLAGCGGPDDDGLPSPGANENVRVLTGRADAAEDGLSITTSDWTYGGGFGFAWMDADDAWHFEDRPECLPPGASRQVTFAVTEVAVNGTRWRPIVWLDCR